MEAVPPDPIETFVGLLVERVRDALATDSPERRFLSKEALAEHYGVAPRTIKTWRSKGLPACKVGRELMFDVAETDRWIERHG